MQVAIVQHFEGPLYPLSTSSCPAHRFEPAHLWLEVPMSDLGEASYKHKEPHIQSPTL